MGSLWNWLPFAASQPPAASRWIAVLVTSVLAARESGRLPLGLKPWVKNAALVSVKFYPVVQSMEEGRDNILLHWLTWSYLYNNWTTIVKLILLVTAFLYSVIFFKILVIAVDIPYHSNQSVSAGVVPIFDPLTNYYPSCLILTPPPQSGGGQNTGKTLCHQSVLKRHQLAVFRRAPDIFQLTKNSLVDTRYWIFIVRHMAY